ncbi:fasciclin domain-containing protein [Pontibacter harenae]|uniref:fasciclin domain-containing protein n=1 Tax=Pontibacter harenae TaxID=2894083 RepID=UPI001E2D3333|nr:fasciclin domain-containing protein [Pontibacter harenae]MCC9168511.1 fasciclin domain-containing protein [Pontibacter harenae]
MRKRMLKPIAAMAVVATTLFGCASSNDSMDNTTAMEGTSMSQTETMGGNDASETTVMAPVAVAAVPIATLNLTNTEDVGDMFENIDDTEKYDAFELAKKSPNLSTFVTLIKQANLVSDLERLEEYTLFAPTNEAFANMPEGRLEMLLQPDNKAQLMQFMQHYILPSEVSSAQFNSTQRISLSENGERYIPVDVRMNGTVTTIGGAQIIKSDIQASNGRIHVIDGIITPVETGGAGTGAY